MIHSVQFSSVAQSCPTLCSPMDCSTPGLPVHHQLPECTQTHIHWVSDAIQPSHPLSPRFSSRLHSFPASGSFPTSQLFESGDQSIGASASASILSMNIQDWFPLGLTSLISLLSKGLSRVFSSTTVRKHQFFGIQPSLWFRSHIRTRLLGNTKGQGTLVCYSSWGHKEWDTTYGMNNNNKHKDTSQIGWGTILMNLFWLNQLFQALFPIKLETQYSCVLRYGK